MSIKNNTDGVMSTHALIESDINDQGKVACSTEASCLKARSSSCQDASRLLFLAPCGVDIWLRLDRSKCARTIISSPFGSFRK